MLVLATHPILNATIEELKQLKACGLQSEDIARFRDPCDYCIFGTGELIEEVMKRYSAINEVFPEVFEFLRWNPESAGVGVECGCCGRGGGRVVKLFICGHVVHFECRRHLRECRECGLLVQEPRLIRIKHNWRLGK